MQNAEIRGDSGEGRLVLGDPGGAGENNLACTLSLQLLGSLREFESLRKIQGGCAGLRLADGVVEDLAIGLEGRDRGGESIGANEHDAVARGERFHVGEGGGAGFVDEGGSPV